MSAVLTLILLTLAALGWGTLLLRLTGAQAMLSPAERLAWAPALGMGAMGWLAFPAVLTLGVSPLPLALAAALGLPGLIWAPRPLGARMPEDWLSRVLLLCIALLAVLDVAAALVPPVDADSMAYHFALPKQWLAAGRLDFVPRAVEAAIPLLLHMTYTQALGLGGETAMLSWCGLSAWFLPVSVAATARRHVPLPWALALALAVKLLPACIYGSPTGQVEVRLAALFMVAVFLAARARRQDGLGPAALAGMAAGFCMAAKYSGMVAPAVCGMLMLGRGRWLGRALAFGAAALLAGGQWYGWNWLHTGDPLFPALWGKLPYLPQVHWDEEMARNFKAYLSMELAAPKSLGWLLYYPFSATFDGLPIFEASRTGFGPLPVLLLPFAMAGAWLRRRHLMVSELWAVMLACLMGYALWYLGGASQRVRHFLPYLAPGLLVLIVAAWRAAQAWPGMRAPLVAAIALSLGIQAGGEALYARQNLRWLAGARDRDAYLAENIAFWPVARWINANLGAGDKIMLTMRELIYLIDAPTYYAHSMYQGLVMTAQVDPDPVTVFSQLRAQGITHLVAERRNPDFNFSQPRSIGTSAMGAALIAAGCAQTIAVIETPREYDSRTLRLHKDGNFVHHVLRIGGPDCHLE